MKKTVFFLLFIMLTLQVIGQKNSLFTKDFEAVKNTELDASKIAQRLCVRLANTFSSSPYTVKFPKGTYHFYSKGAIVQEMYISNHDQTNPKKIGFLLKNIKDVTIDAQGSTFIFHGRMIPFLLVNCKNVKLKNFTVDFADPQLRQLNILSVNKENKEVVAEIYPNDTLNRYIVKEGKLITLGSDYTYRPIYSNVFDSKGHLKYQHGDMFFSPKKVTELSAGILKIAQWDYAATADVGDKVVIRSGERPSPGIVVSACKDIYLHNIQVHYAEGMGLLAQLTENITLQKFGVTRSPKDKRIFTTQADATHFSACKGRILSENGLYENMADDAINVHGTYLKVTKKINDSTLEVRYMHGQTYGIFWGEKNDEVQILETSTMEIVKGTANKIKYIKPIDANRIHGAKEFEIVLQQPLPEEVNLEKGSFAIENLTWTPEVIFRKNIVRNNRARGALFSTPKKVLCEKNIFDHTHGAAILLCGDANGWYETGACKEVIIRKNKFINALTANYQFTEAIISIYPVIPKLVAQKDYFHSNILIEHNVFHAFDNPILYAKSVDGLTFRKNKIKHNKDFPAFHKNKQMFTLEKVRNYTLEPNKWGKPFHVKKDVVERYQ